ncbi:MAG: MopE-related protein [archaeon]
MKKLFILGLIILSIAVLVSAYEPGVRICGVEYNCSPLSDTVCPMDFGADCNYIYCDWDCWLLSYYAPASECPCVLGGDLWIPTYGCCGDQADEDNPWLPSETRCLDNVDDDCNGDIDCEDYAVGGECPPPACGNCRSAVCNHVNYDWELTQIDCTPACCVFESPQYCADCTHCGDGSCNCGEDWSTCLGDCPVACIPGTWTDCPMQLGVCAGSQQQCDATGNWPGCDENNYNSSGNFQWAPEYWCDALDNDCNGFVDERCDSDLDRFCDDFGGLNDTDVIIIEGTIFPDNCGPLPNSCCNKTDATDSSTIDATDDCNDANPLINPDGTEWCGDNEDYNCDGEDDDFGEGLPCGIIPCDGNNVCNGFWEVYCNSNGTDCGGALKCCLCNETGETEYDETQDTDCGSTPCPVDDCVLGLCGDIEAVDYPIDVSHECQALDTCLINTCEDASGCTGDADLDTWASNITYNNCRDCDDTTFNDPPGCPGGVGGCDFAFAGCAVCTFPGSPYEVFGDGIDTNCDGADDPPTTCVDDDKDGYGVCPSCGGVVGCLYEGHDCDDNTAGEPPICLNLDDPAIDICNQSSIMCAFCINPGVDETYDNINPSNIINYCYDTQNNDCDIDGADYRDPGCRAIVYGYITNLFTEEPIAGAMVTAYHDGPRPNITDPLSNMMTGYYNLTTFAGKYFFQATRDSYFPQLKEKTVLGHEARTQLNFSLTPGICSADCTDYHGWCADCWGYQDPATGETCEYYDQQAYDFCLGQDLGTVIVYNISTTQVCYLDCCEGRPKCMERLPVNVTGNVEDLFKRTLILKYLGRPIKLNILVWE